jgi:hypothetical protein
MPENVGAATSRSPKGLHGLYRDNFTFTLPLGLGIEEVLQKLTLHSYRTEAIIYDNGRRICICHGK